MQKEAKIVKIFKKKMPWGAHIINDAKIARDLDMVNDVETRMPRGSLCSICKGARMLCHKERCPILTKISAYLKIRGLMEKEKVEGSSPPGVFIGRLGYPNVYAGPLVPPFHGNTGTYDIPELWFGKSIEEIVDFRLRLVRGKHLVNVTKPERAGRIEVQPIGPSERIRNLKVGTMKLDSRMEKAYYDTDLKAADAVADLYTKGTLVSKLQKALSVGAFGVQDQRRLVPTRWSITAVDSMISLNLAEKVKDYQQINEFRVYESNYLDNRFEIIMIPDAWKYEAIEAWYPGTVWNPSSSDIFLIGDWEDYHGRAAYAKMGGCYYAARLAICEKLNKEKRQASAIVLREAHPGYIMPVGVWQVRESTRNALSKEPLKFTNLDNVLKHVESKFDIGIKTWIENSKLLKDSLTQTKLTKFVF
jgi:hypothetical protein